MDNFSIRPLNEGDIDEIMAAAGGRRAHENTDQRSDQSADYRLGDTLIELKALDDDGLAKPERQAKLAALFRPVDRIRPVMVLDRAQLPIERQREFDRIMEGPIKSEVRSARKQLKQSKLEHPDATTTILFVINNGYTALDHKALVDLIVHRVRNDTTQIDGVVVGGCYFHSDTFDSYFLWPLDYVPINLERPFSGYDALRGAWNGYSNRFMSALMTGDLGPDLAKGPVMDSQFEIEGVTYVKPAAPLGGESAFFPNGRPRKSSSGVDGYPPVATTFPDLTRAEWGLFRSSLQGHDPRFDTYEAEQALRRQASKSTTPLCPFVPIGVTHQGWQDWCDANDAPRDTLSLADYANDLFEIQLRELRSNARERAKDMILPARYAFLITEEIGQDRANDLSHIAIVNEMVGPKGALTELLSDARIFFEHALALTCAYAVSLGVRNVIWQKDRRYMWA